MTRLAAHTFIHVDLVAEINKVGEIVNTSPLDRLLIAEARTHWFEHGRVRPDLRVAVHASLGRRNAGKTGSFNGGVTVAAIDALAANVMGMAKGYGLFRPDTLLGHPRRPLQTVKPEADRPQQDDHQR